MLEFTRNLIGAIVGARNYDPEAKELLSVVYNHTNGMFRDVRVSDYARCRYS